ncbi:hypothetical protein [Sorangium sp. So ce887]|uniref:hypothetical protein n=1 Tax=Sorangium sp. So ce887 TaxID=3133324 RepID=UPI003F5E0CD6
MSLFSKGILPLTLLGAAAVLGGCASEASLEGDDEQETQPEAAEAADPESADSIDPDAAEAVGTAQQAQDASEAPVYYTLWSCWRYYHEYQNGKWQWIGRTVGWVELWWGHRYSDAEWACNSWVGECGSDEFSCRAVFRDDYIR